MLYTEKQPMASTKIRADDVSNDITHSVHRLSNHSSPRVNSVVCAVDVEKKTVSSIKRVKKPSLTRVVHEPLLYKKLVN